MKETKTSSKYLLDISRDYSLYVCSNRAIPHMADGLKDAQRKAIWILKGKNEKIKTISVAGEMISSGLYLHGDASAAGAVSMLAAPYCNNVTLIDGIGTFGTRVAPSEWAAPRYTYVKRTSTTQSLVLPDQDIIPTNENYDGSTLEPTHFLPLIPLVLLNGVSGIAVGWSTEILPRNFTALVDATIAAVKGKTVKTLIPTYKLYSCNVSHLEGNTWEITGRCSIVDTSTIRVTELPPDLSLEKFKERLNKLEDEGSINGYVDRSTKTIDITVKMTRGSIRDWDEEKAISFLKLRSRKTERIVVLDLTGKNIKQYQVAEDLVKDFAAWRLDWYETRFQKMKDDDHYELQYWKAILECFKGNFAKKIDGLADKEAVVNLVKTLIKKIVLDDDQLNKIVSLSSYKWANDFKDEVEEKIKKLEGNIKTYTRILNDPEERKAIYIEELEALKKIKF